MIKPTTVYDKRKSFSAKDITKKNAIDLAFDWDESCPYQEKNKGYYVNIGGIITHIKE